MPATPVAAAVRSIEMESRRGSPRARPWERAALLATFACAALRYWLTIFPRVALELRRWRRRAELIPDPVLRELAREALGKRANIEGAAAFAAAMPGRRRAACVRALVAFQAIYNYADVLAEQPNSRPAAAARRLHEALLVALDPQAAHGDYYALQRHREDGGYLGEMVDACRAALRALPSYPAVASAARAAAADIVAFQSLSVGDRLALERWARARSPVPSSARVEGDLRWWELAAAAGSSLAVHALVASAAARRLAAAEVAAIDALYTGPAGALHSLLDSAVDQAEDAATGQLSLVGCYPTADAAARRLRQLAASARASARLLPGGRRHLALVAAMACNYLSEPQGAAPGAAELGRGVREAIGELTGPALLVFAVRRRAARMGRGSRRGAVERRSPAVRTCERGADARAA